MSLRDELHFIDLTARMALKADSAATVFGSLWWRLELLLLVTIYYKASDMPAVGVVCWFNIVQLPSI